MMNRAPTTQAAVSALRAARLAHLLTQSDLARAAGMSQTRLSAIERGVTFPRDPEEAAAIATIVEQSVNALWPGMFDDPAT